MKGPRALFREATGDSARLPLLVLFILNMVDELDQVTYGVVAPNIRDTFGVKEATIVSVGSLSAALVIMLVVPIGYQADRRNRVKMVSFAALAWGSMTLLTGISGFVGAFGLLILARFGAGIGRVMNEPVHVSLLADYYPPMQHGRIYSIHRAANAIGAGTVLLCALIADLVGWRFGFMLLAVPTFIAWTLLTRLDEPVRGASIDQALALRAESASDKVPFTEAWRRLKGIPSLKRSWWAAVFVGASVVPIAIFLNFFFEKVYNVDSITARGAITTLYALGSLAGLQLGSNLSTKALMGGNLPQLARLGGATLAASAIGLLCLAQAPWIGLSIVFVFVIGLGTSFNSYGLPLLTAISPPRLRSQALGYFVFFVGLGAGLLSPIVAGLGTEYGYRFAISILSILLLVAGAIYASMQSFVRRDAEQAYNTLMFEAGIRSEQAAGRAGALLTCRGVEVAYGQVQVLFGVDLDVMPGEIVALLGTNGAGKSTLLRAISGTTDPMGGAIFFAGEDITHAEPGQTAALGIVQVPGGKAVFPTLTVAEHLRAAGWLYREDPDYLHGANAAVLEMFPRLAERFDQLAGNLSGGEQQMLALGMAFIAKPRLLIIDELSLGLAPTIVEQLLGVVRRIQEAGTAVLLVEQSINVALTLAERAYFMEKGEVRFEGPTAELLERDDIVRSVFLDGAAVATGGKKVAAKAAQHRATIAESPVILSADGLVKRFGGIQAVSDASFTLRAGEILGLIGPNGAGKTTIFDLISGFTKVDEGRITLDGADVTNHSPDRRASLGLGRSFQDARLVPSLTVAENLAIGLERHLEVRDHLASLLSLPGVVRQEEDVAWTVEDLIELMHLGAYRDKFVRELSTGSRRIVDLAMCIGHDPKVLLLDEPSSGIAQKETEALGPLLERIQQETGCALLVIEHDMPLITSVSDRMIALELGTPIVEGTPQEVTTDPRVVSSYLGGDIAAINRSGTARGAGSSNGATAPKTTRATKGTGARAKVTRKPTASTNGTRKATASANGTGKITASTNGSGARANGTAKAGTQSTANGTRANGTGATTPAQAHTTTTKAATKGRAR